MRGLVLTLYIGVFVVLLGLGWAIDQYYNSILETDQQQPYPGYRAALQIVSSHFTTHNMSDQEMQHYLDSQPVKFTLEPLDEFPLPESLLSIRDSNQIFMLQSSAADTLYQRISTTPWLLTLEIELATEPEKQNTRYLLTFIFYGGVATILLLWLFPLLRSVRQLNAAAKEIGLGHLETRVENPDSLYLKPLKKEFNAMAERLQHLNENNRLMSQAVSHELRTPLSRLRFALDLLQGREQQSQREQDIQRMEADLDDMENLINELLNYSRLDQTHALNIEPVKIETLIQQRLARRIEKGCIIEFQMTRKNSLISGDYDFLCKLIDNLIQNACRYANSRVVIDCSWSDSQFQLTVADDGTGISAAETENIFKPFYRVKNQQVQKSSGFGLGLAIVKRIVVWHSGTINVTRSSQLGGALFEVILPVAKSIPENQQ